MSIKNHLQIAEARMSPQELWRKNLRRNPENPWGIETPLGHTYSLILEALVSENIDANPDPNGFLEYIRDFLIYRHGYLRSEISMTASSLDIMPIIEYMKSKGLSKKSRASVFEEITGAYASIWSDL